MAVDLPGHGSSPIGATGLRAAADAIAAFADELALPEVDLVANDTGGAVAQVFAAHNPQRLRTFALTNCDTKDNSRRWCSSRRSTWPASD